MNLLMTFQKLCKPLFVLLLTVTAFNFNAYSQETVVQRVRLDFTAPDGSVRQILLGFTSDNSASDGFDYGWDAINWDNFANDMNWMIEDTRCIIQGVGSFEETKTYPMGVFLAEEGNINISLNSLENFEEDIDVYVHDTAEGTYTLINETDFESLVPGGEYEDRFYIAFNAPVANSVALSNDEYELLEPSIRYSTSTNEIVVNTSGTSQINSLSIFDISGRRIHQQSISQTNSLKTYFKTQAKGNYIVSIGTDQGNFSKILTF